MDELLEQQTLSPPQFFSKLASGGERLALLKKPVQRTLKADPSTWFAGILRTAGLPSIAVKELLDILRRWHVGV